MYLTGLTLKNHPELKRVIRLADPTYAKHKANLEVHTKCDLYGTYWDGGTRYTYTAVDILSGKAVTAEQFDPPQFGGPRETPVVAIPEGVAIVRTGTFCGRTATATVHLNPVNAAKLIPQGATS